MTNLGKEIKEARVNLGWSQEELGAKIGTTQSTIERIENGGSLRSRFRHEAAAAVGVSIPGLIVPQTGFRPPPTLIGDRDLPVYAAAEGGPGEMVISTDPIDVVPRPWYLGTVKDGYGVLIVGESMSPAYDPGDIAIVNPKLPPTRNKPFIITSNDEDGEFRATIKQLMGWSTDVWRVRQYSPPKDFDLLKREWPKAVRVVGKYNV